MLNDSSDLSHSTVIKTRSLPWGPASAIVVTVLAFGLAQFVAVYATGIIAALTGAARHGDWENSVAGQFVFVLISEALTMLILWRFLRRRRANLRLLGYFRRPNFTDAAFAAMGFLAYFGFLLIVMSLLHSFTHVNLDQKQELGFDKVIQTSEMILTFISLVVLPPLVEESIFRGFLYGGLRTKLSVSWSMLLTSIMFALPHLFESSSGILWVAGVDTFLLSLVLCYLREKTGNLWAGIGVHMLKNGIAFLFLYVFVNS